MNEKLFTSIGYFHEKLIHFTTRMSHSTRISHCSPKSFYVFRMLCFHDVKMMMISLTKIIANSCVTTSNSHEYRFYVAFIFISLLVKLFFCFSLFLRDSNFSLCWDERSHDLFNNSQFLSPLPHNILIQFQQFTRQLFKTNFLALARRVRCSLNHDINSVKYLQWSRWFFMERKYCIK